MKAPGPRRGLAFACAATAALIGGCTAEPHLLVITLDTARADRFSYTGESPVQTPAVDSLADDGTAFLQAVSPAPITLPAHASLFTGQLPARHGVRNNGTYRLSEDAVTLAELLERRGYRTGAFVGSAVLAARYGLDQGFDHYDDAVTGTEAGTGLYAERTGDAVVDAALQWIDRVAGPPTFAWVHLFDPHVPYRPPEPERSLHPGSPYDAEIAYADRVIGRLLEAYRERGLYDDAIVVFASDHGEGLGDHGEPTHGIFVFDTTVKVPLIIRAPGFTATRRVDAQVQLIDVLPTLAEILRLPLPDGVQGSSLVARLRGRDAPADPAFIETVLPRESYGWFELRAVRTPDWKLISGTYPELYDLRSDPAELDDVASIRPQRVAEMTGMLGAPGAEPGSERRIELDEAARRQLASLGYVSSVSPSESGTSPDPRERHRERLLRTALDLFDRGLEQEAAERCSRLLARHPDDQRIASGCERLRGSPRDEAERRGAGGGAEPASGADLAATLASAEANAAKRDAGAVREALTQLTKALASGSGDARTPDAEMLQIASGLGRVGDACWAAYTYGEAAHAFMLAARLVPSDPRPAYNAGLAWERMGDMSEALRAYDRALALDPDLPNLRKHRDYAAAVLARIVGRPGATE